MVRTQIDPKITFNFELKMPRVQYKSRDTAVVIEAARMSISQGLRYGVRDAADNISDALGEAMSQSVWGWPNVTIRKSGSQVGKPRDIVDLAGLKNNATITSEIFGGLKTITITYTAPYAAIVHYGGVTRPYGKKTGNSFIYPARPWISSMLTGVNGIEQFKVLDYVDAAVKREWRKRYSSF